MTNTSADLVIRKRVEVQRSPEEAFALFTSGINSWWPLKSHSIGEEQAQIVVCEGHAGGRLYERRADGTESNWGEVITLEPPRRVVIRWEVNPENPHTEVDVRFTANGAATVVELEHRGWERYGDRAGPAYSEYNSALGWDLVLGCYERVARPA